MSRNYDLVVVGGGSAGLTAATIAGRVGARVLLVDRERLGGECLYSGCVPSKALIRCAQVAHTVSQAGRFGVTAGRAAERTEVDYGEVAAYIRQAIHAAGRRDTPEYWRARGVEVAFGGARFLSPKRLEVGGDRVVDAARVIVATGSRARIPSVPGLEAAGYLDNERLFSLTELPRRLLIVGGGPMGVEMGQALARLGSRVTLVEAGERLLPRDDAELVDLLQQRLRGEIELVLGASPAAAAPCGSDSKNGVGGVADTVGDAGGKEVTLEQAGERRTLVCDEILIAAGRRPNLEELALEEAGIEYSDRGIQVDDHLRTTAAGVWACGDCAGPYHFTHFAEAQARVAARNALFRGGARFTEPWVPWTTFTDPELAHVGLTEAEACRSHRRVHVYRYPYDALDRAICEGATFGLAKVVCDGRGRILGASLLGARSGEALPELVVAMRRRIRLTSIAAYPHVYPTMNRIVRRLGDEVFLEKGVGHIATRLFARFRVDKNGQTLWADRREEDWDES